MHHSNVSFIFRFTTALRFRQPQWAERHLRPPGSHSKELAKTISLKSPAILIWQPGLITRRKNCFSCHQQSLGNYLNCVMIMPQSASESFTLLLSNTQERWDCSQVRRGLWGKYIQLHSFLSAFCNHTNVTHRLQDNSKPMYIKRD